MGAEAVHVSAAVMEDGQGRVLLTRRSDDGDLAGAWEFPGGKREHGETAQQALCRELHEELGIRVRVGARSGKRRVGKECDSTCIYSGSPDLSKIKKVNTS